MIWPHPLVSLLVCNHYNIIHATTLFIMNDHWPNKSILQFWTLTLTKSEGINSGHIKQCYYFNAPFFYCDTFKDSSVWRYCFLVHAELIYYYTLTHIAKIRACETSKTCKTPSTLALLNCRVSVFDPAQLQILVANFHQRNAKKPFRLLIFYRYYMLLPMSWYYLLF